jgi:transcriptional regulator with XRE-family HTH domain
MSHSPEHITARIRELREILDIPVEKAAETLGISRELYASYESGEASIPINSLYGLAELFGVDVTELLTGERPRMDRYTVVRAGQGVVVDRYPGYKFESLAANFRGRVIEPMLVTLEPHEDEAHEPALVKHHGQEFNLVLKGTVKVVVGKHAFVLNAGDSIYFDATAEHGQRALGGPALFLTVIQN